MYCAIELVMSTAAVAAMSADKKTAMLRALSDASSQTEQGGALEALGAVGAMFAAMSPETRAAAITVAKASKCFTYELYTTFGSNNKRAVGITFGLAAADGDAKSKGSCYS